MTLIKSISGIRGTIGGGAGEGLNPLDIVKFTSAYATLIRKTCKAKSNKIVVGRDARISGEMVKNVVVGTLMGMGWDVVDIDLASRNNSSLNIYCFSSLRFLLPRHTAKYAVYINLQFILINQLNSCCAAATPSLTIFIAALAAVCALLVSSAICARPSFPIT